VLIGWRTRRRVGDGELSALRAKSVGGYDMRRSVHGGTSMCAIDRKLCVRSRADNARSAGSLHREGTVGRRSVGYAGVEAFALTLMREMP